MLDLVHRVLDGATQVARELHDGRVQLRLENARQRQSLCLFHQRRDRGRELERVGIEAPDLLLGGRLFLEEAGAPRLEATLLHSEKLAAHRISTSGILGTGSGSSVRRRSRAGRVRVLARTPGPLIWSVRSERQPVGEPGGLARSLALVLDRPAAALGRTRSGERGERDASRGEVALDVADVAAENGDRAEACSRAPE